MNGADAVAQRLCPDCGAFEPIKPGEAVWPISWRCRSCGRTVPDAFGIPMFEPGLADTPSGFDPAAFDMLAKIEATHFWFVARNELIVGLVDKYFAQARCYLEIGCGNGAVLQALERSRNWDRMVGSDLHPRRLAYARARLAQRVEFAQLDARAIAAKAAFDLIGAYDIIEHVADDEAMLRSMHRAIAPGGGVLIAYRSIRRYGAASTNSVTTSGGIVAAKWSANYSAMASLFCSRHLTRQSCCH